MSKESGIPIGNTASQAVLARLGMKPTGEIVYEGIRAGRWSIGNPGED